MRPRELKLRFIEPMYSRLANELPEGREWLYKLKFEATVILAEKDSTEIAAIFCSLAAACPGG